MAERQRLALQVPDEIFMDPLSENDGKDNLEKNYCVSAEQSPELDKEVPNEMTDTRSEPVRSTSNQRFHRTGRAGHRGRQFCSSSLPLFKYYN